MTKIISGMWSLILVAVLLFLVFVPVVPLVHSSPPHAKPSSWPSFFGSVTDYLFHFGIEVNGVGVVKFNMPS